MPKQAAELGPLAVSRIKDPGVHFVGGIPGLALQVSPTGGRSWILRVMVGGKRRDIGLGGYPAVVLVDARTKAREARDKIRAGIDPVAEARAVKSALIASVAKQFTFSDAAKAFIKAKEKGWRSQKHAARWRSSLKTYAEPFLGNMLVSDIDIHHVEKVLEPIWSTRTETACRVRGRIEAILAWATVRKYRSGLNPAMWRGNLDHLLAAPRKVTKVQHFTALHYTQIGNFMTELRQRPGIGARALEFTILTAARSGEVRGATWQEIDFDACLWTIPEERMKAGKEHRVPLSASAINLLKSLPDSDNELVFPAPRGGMLSDMTLSAVIRRMNRDGKDDDIVEDPQEKWSAVPHGFRSTFRDWCAEQTNYPREVAEMALAHAVESAVEAAYRRGDMFEKRRKLMQDWANYCTKPSVKAGEVVPIRKTLA